MARVPEETKRFPEQRTEIRDFGDRKQIVLYTTNNEVYQRLKKYATKEVPYEIWKDCDPQKAKVVAVDLYFPKNKKEAIKKRVLNVDKSLKSKSESLKVKKV